MIYAIYDNISGKIDKVIAAPTAEFAAINCTEGQSFVEINHMDCTHIDVVTKQPYKVDPPPLVIDKIGMVRRERDYRLKVSDWTQMPDVPLSEGQKQQWAVYRQALRDFPEVCDPDNPVWPVPPS